MNSESMDYARLLTDHLQRHAHAYFERLPPDATTVELRRSSERINSTLFEFSLAASSTEQRVIAKIPFAVTAHLQTVTGSGEDRPRLAPKPATVHKSQHEYETLAAIEDCIERRPDPRFDAVRILDWLPEHSVLLMEKAPASGLNRQLLSVSRGQRRRHLQRVAESCRRAGAWLRMFHGLPDLSYTRPRNETRDDFSDSIARFAKYLANSTGQRWFQRIGEQIRRCADSILPDALPLGLSHGDYAPRNVLVDAAGRVRIIDTLGRWRAPIYEDIGRFLCALHVSQLQVWSQGWAYRQSVLDQLERHFLVGYFVDQPIPYPAIRLFECQALLDRWTSFVHSSTTSTRPVRRRVKQIRQWWWQRYFSRHLRQKLQQSLIATKEQYSPSWESIA